MTIINLDIDGFIQCNTRTYNRFMVPPSQMLSMALSCDLPPPITGPQFSFPPIAPVSLLIFWGVLINYSENFLSS